MLRKIVLAFALLALALSVSAEPRFASISATSTAASTTLAGTPIRSVTLYNAGSKDVWFRLFTDADTTGDATTAAPSSILPAGGTLTYPLKENDTETFVGTTKARTYRSISTKCGGSDTTTVYVWFK